jgi:hypothetical protein
MKAAHKFFPVVFLLFAVLLNSCADAKNITFLTPQSTITVESSQTITQYPTFAPSPILNDPASAPAAPFANKTAKLSSPYDNVKVAYNDQGWLWVWQKGSSRAITPVGLYTTLSFSSDGKKIVFTRNGELLSINSDGTNEKILINSEDLGIIAPHNPDNSIQLIWIPNTPYLIITTWQEWDITRNSNNDLYLYNFDTEQWKTVFHPGEGGRITVSPNGEYIAVVTQEKIILMNSDGSNQHTALTFEPYKFEYYPYFPRPYWSEDSQSLIIETQSMNPTLTPDTSHYPPNEPLVKVWLIPIIGTPKKILQTTEYYDLYYSPDLSKFVYVTQTRENKPAELHVVNRDGSKDQILYTTTKKDENYRHLYFYNWSPDSKSIIFDELDDKLAWMDIQNGSINTITLKPGEPPYRTSLIWLDSSHLVAYRHTIDGIWLAVPEEKYIQIAKLHDSVLSDYYFADGFDIFVGDNKPAN